MLFPSINYKMEEHKIESNQIFLLAQNWLIFFILLGGSVYLTSIIASSYFPRTDNTHTFMIELKSMSIKLFGVLKPFVELFLIFWLADWVLRKVGCSISAGLKKKQWRVEKFLIIALLFIFMILALVLTEAIFYLKSIILLIGGILIGIRIKHVGFDSKILKIIRGNISKE
ncbi:hypothetical protein ACOKFD_07710 [Flagellimonas sp. S174]|uniref:hypothetical protein n=1 Tax=Flagellimonas sp. S174 TaxID=3410790 RepID=UPI003BF588C6